MKDLLSNTVIFLLLFVGGLLIGWHFIQEDVILYFTQLEVNPEEFTQNMEISQETAEFDPTVVRSLEAFEWLNYINVDEELFAVGELLIPSIELNLPIFLGVAEPNISLGVGTVVSNLVKGEGNYILASHWDPSPRVRFGGLHLVQPGDALILRDSENLFIYETIIGDNYIIAPNRWDIADVVEGKVYLTLFTCTPDGSERVMVRGELIEIINIEELRYAIENDIESPIIQSELLPIELTTIIEMMDADPHPFPILPVSATIGSSGLIAILVISFSSKPKKSK